MGSGIINWVDGLKALLFGFCAVFTVTVFVFMFTPLANVLAMPLITEPVIKKSDVIVVMGGGAYPNGVLGGTSGVRFLTGLGLYKEGFAPRLFFAGGTISGTSKKIIKTISKSEESGAIDVIESAIMLDTAKKLGIPDASIYADLLSTNTYANLLAVKEFMKKNNLKTCLIVTSPTHMYRSWRVAEKLGLGCSPAPVPDYTKDILISTMRLHLLREVLWEYAALALYRAYGYI
ncbi:MAG: YdcF family protein [Thermodesulfobacteriota bacterium]